VRIIAKLSSAYPLSSTMDCNFDLERIVDAYKRGRCDDVRICIQFAVDPRKITNHILDIACESNNLPMVKMLIKDAHLTRDNIIGNDFIIRTLRNIVRAKKHHISIGIALEIIKLLSLEDVRADNNCLLRDACVFSTLEVIKALVEKGLTKDDINGSDGFILYKTCMMRRPLIVEYLLEHGADFKAILPVSRKELKYSLASCRSDYCINLLKLMYNHIVDYNWDAVYSGGNTKMESEIDTDIIYYCGKNAVKLVKALYKMEPRMLNGVKNSSEANCNPLICALYDDNVEMVVLLVDLLDLTIDDILRHEGEALKIMCKSNNVDMLQFFFKKLNLTIDDILRHDGKALKIVCYHNNVDMLQFFFNIGLKFEHINKYPNLLVDMCQGCHTNVMLMLLNGVEMAANRDLCI
jgi:hypothetical protein